MTYYPFVYLGFIGPEKHLQEVQQITSEYHKFHILPFEPDQDVPFKTKNLSLFVGNRRWQLRSKVIYE